MRSIGRCDLIRPAWDVRKKILLGVIGLIRCGGACDRQRDVFLRFKLGGVNGLEIQVKRCGQLGVAQ